MAENELTKEMLLWAVAGGFLPALFWLWFWLREDAKKPEPKGLIALTFMAGVLSVIIILAFSHIEEFLLYFLDYEIPASVREFMSGTRLIIFLATMEEAVKYIAIYTIALRSRYFDEPVDAVVYAITVALGFAAMENFLYILNVITENNIITTIMSGNMRFIGATLLHTVSSATIGVGIAISFYKHRIMRILSLVAGFVAASLLHTTFNLLIIKTRTVGEILTVFLYLWILVIILIILFEKIKLIRPK